MKEIKNNPGLVVCLIIAALGVVLALPKKSAVIVQKQNSIITPIVNALKPATATAKGAVGEHVPILMYHHVGEVTDPKVADLFVSATDFESQVVYFHDKGYQTITLQQVYDDLENNITVPAKSIVFTFDDGYKDVFDNAIPILEKYGYTATLAIATELLGRPSYATWDDVIGAKNAGMEVVSHSENHLDLTNKIYSEVDLRREIFDSKQILEQKLGTTINFFVYPYGKYNEHVESLVKEAGYKIALTTAYGQYVDEANLFATPRVRVHGVDGLEKLKLIFEPKPHSASAQTNL